MTTFNQGTDWLYGAHRSLAPFHVASVVITEPAIEPVSLTEVKNRLRISSTADDADLVGLILAARKQVEKDLDGSLVATLWDTWLDRCPTGRVLEIPRWPLQSVTSITSYDTDDAATVLASTEYLVDVVSRPGRIILNSDASWPSSLRSHQAVAIRHTSGFSGAAKAVTSITRSSAVATVTTPAAHGYATGNRITHAGANQAEYDVTAEIAVTGASTYTFAVTGSPVSPATGTITATALGIPELYTLAVMTLVGHWWDRLRTGMTTAGQESELPFGYSALISDRVMGMA